MLDPEKNRAPNHIKTIHLMGICGTGMAALAGMLQQSGYIITGSDAQVYPPMSHFLQQIGIDAMEGYRAQNLAHKPDLVVVGNVITKKNPEAQALAKNGLPYLSFPQALAEFFIRSHTSIVVAGTHGKTTTCSLLASALFHAGLDPSFMIGGIVKEFSGNNRIGQGPYFIAEGDEYDTAFFDKESKFLHYRPHMAIITSIEFDHADIFTDLNQIKNAFRKFVGLLPADGLIIAHLDDKNVAEVVAEAPCRVEGYGFDAENQWNLSDLQTSAQTTSFSVRYKEKVFPLSIPLSGKHNCLNALAVTAILHHTGISFDMVEHCLSKFSGVKRRQEIRGIVGGITVIDDFAHHPTAVKETLAGLKAAFPGKRLVAVFEPRTNSSRRAVFQKEYAEAFNSADLVLLREPQPLQNVAADDHFSCSKLAQDIRQSKHAAWSFQTTAEMLDHLIQHLRSGDVVAILSNGGFDNIHERLLARLQDNQSSPSKDTSAL
ncbi:MAG: UDP-N-acetylmuramate:L-alanyl-gamma-D-glutamyl-meso-diaminopimelate ligase [Desulfopila sp.]|jgi:UDP-N-acetylmuramate: L-alanyl-gamma-D-glutamyl-meso-diaminopimelate ligase|nr:UDP-N-acetylmuramate:L-alanyl-gamma-D-glutamyl-meso-diaminopimelate ligase [Desulfopila sp.]